jgi:hypothetical protein
MGENLYPPDEGNPKGYFEDAKVNAINEALLAQVIPARPPGLIGKLLFRSRLREGQRWLAILPVGVSIVGNASLKREIRILTSKEPFCFKDPRFCYTLHVWRPFIKDAVLICVFRDPRETAMSILKECKRERHLRNIKMTIERGIEIWEAMYRHVLEVHYPEGGEWLFFHYDQFINGSALRKLAHVLDAPVDSTFVDKQLRRSFATGMLPSKVKDIYQRLCDLAGYSPSEGAF